MDIKQTIVKRLNSLYNFAITQEKFDNVTLFGIGKRIKHTRAEYLRKLLEESDNLLLDTLVSDYIDPKQRAVARTILKNQLAHLSLQPDHTSSAAAGNFKNILMGVAAQAVKHLLTFDNIIGIQPMAGPVGLVYHMSYIMGDKPTTDDSSSTADKTTTNDKSDDLSSAFKQQPSIRLEIVSAAIEAKSRKLQAMLTIEAMQDLKFHHLDFESELTQILATEIASEWANEIIHDLAVLATLNPESRTLDLTTAKPTMTGGPIQWLLIELNRCSTGIARLTRRGPGQRVITSATGLALLESACKASHLSFVRAPKDEYTGDPNSLCYAGYLTSDVSSEHRMYEVYTTWAPALNAHSESEVKYIIGYRGKVGSVDTGYIYAPYIPLTTKGVVVNPYTFQPIIGFMTRYGKWTKKFKRETELDVIESTYQGKSSDYYTLLTVKYDSENMVSISDKTK